MAEPVPVNHQPPFPFDLLFSETLYGLPDTTFISRPQKSLDPGYIAEQLSTSWFNIAYPGLVWNLPVPSLVCVDGSILQRQKRYHL
jgi:hypothetical protein